MEITDHGLLELMIEDKSSSAPDFSDLVSPFARPVPTRECQVHRPNSLSSDVNSIWYHDMDVFGSKIAQNKIVR